MPIIGVDGFDCDKFDEVLIATLSKKNLGIEHRVAKAVIFNFLIELQEQGVAIFESQSLADQRIWKTFGG